MKSGKQRRAEIKTSRRTRALKAKTRESRRRLSTLATVPCNPVLLKPDNSYSDPAFVVRGFYLDLPFTCRDCGRHEVWSATQQKWWYEVAGGDVWTTAVRCRACRRKERERKNEARRVHLEGVAHKEARTNDS